MPRSDKKYSNDDLTAVLDKLTDFDDRLDKLGSLLIDVLVLQQQFTALSSGGDASSASGLSASPSQEQLGQLLSRYVFNQADDF